mmetsp:Transcript_71290/g.220298  ORF Transcript_71290/g.220298 Transcript_71290/m.220298 type:complete len:427 (-) Transcript_71290:93-1373(-)
MAKYVLASMTMASLAASVAPSFLSGSGAGRLRGSRSALALNNSAAVPPLTPVSSKTPIKLLISAFQDGERCSNTMFQALRKAEHPERIFFEVAQAVGPQDVRCDEEFRTRHAPQLCSAKKSSSGHCLTEVLGKLRFKHIPLEEGKGPVHQRGLLSEFANLTGDDSMCLAIDSHMDFAHFWDKELLQDWANTGNEFAVLSAYPFATEQMYFAGTSNWIELCGYFLTETGIPRGATARPVLDEPERRPPQLTLNWAAGQSFARCHAERNVPADKNLEWMFDGEEVNRAVRFWTSGYDLYNPRVNVVLHNYSSAAQKFWSYSEPDMRAKQLASEARLKALLQGDAPRSKFGKYGLGDQRSLEQYVTWARTNLGGKWGGYLAGKGITPHFADWTPGGAFQPFSVADFCSHLQRVPVRDAQKLSQSAAAPL